MGRRGGSASQNPGTVLGSPRVSKGGLSGTAFCCNYIFTVAKTILIDRANQSKAVCFMNTHEYVVAQVSSWSWLKKESEHQRKSEKQNPLASY